MLFASNWRKSLNCRIHAYRIRFGFLSIGVLMLAGCGNSAEFVHEPPESLRIPMPAEIKGVWAREGKDNGERVRVSRLDDGAVRFDFFKAAPTGEPLPVESVTGRALHFDNQDWLLLDRRNVVSPGGGAYTGLAPYMLTRYVLENPDRLCGISPSASVFAEAIKAGQLEGTVDTFFKPWIRVTVSSAGADWVNWWISLPGSRKMYAAPAFCFQRVN